MRGPNSTAPTAATAVTKAEAVTVRAFTCLDVRTARSAVVLPQGSLEHEYSQLKRWIEANGGRYSPSVRKGITHLIAGKDAWKNASNAVQAAIKIGAFVVNYEWLEDSLQKRRKLAETKYTWEYLWQKRRREKKMKSLGLLADAKKFNDGCKEASKATGTGMSTSQPRVITRKPKQSKSFFFGDVVNKPFVSAADDLQRRRVEREAAQAKRDEEKAMKKIEQAKTEDTTLPRSSAAPSITSNAETISSPTSVSSHALSTTSFPSSPPEAVIQAKKPALKDLYHFFLDSTGSPDTASAFSKATPSHTFTARLSSSSHQAVELPQTLITNASKRYSTSTKLSTTTPHQ
ncbi:hypothetical protein OPT61_g7750 [Boeremia exigua]|uniref:Uncharacterized protein n=1 Tax=Boeremia exigua TaxID=749465 RepID=A0ACC2I205_9PLEO|nr:hypothetical protein OPT61_g7750 [Boeremia exigua]